MTERLLALGPITLGVELEGDALRERFDWRYPGDPASLPASARIHLRPAPVVSPIDLAWQPELRSEREGTTVAIDWPQAKGRFDLVEGRGEFEVRVDARGYGLAIDDILRVVGYEIALARDVLLLHAAAVGPADSDWVDLFAGRSDAGKTTVTERLLAAGEAALSDDLVFVDAPEAGPARALSTPFKGAMRASRLRAGPAIIRSLAFLTKADPPGFRPIEGAERLVRVLSAVVRYRPLSSSETERVTARASRLCAICPTGELALTLTADARAIMDAAVSAHRL